MSNKLFVGGLAWATDDHSLRAAFEGFGTVTDAKVITDRETGRSRGFGFVTLSSSDEANAAMEAMEGSDLDGRTIRVNLAQEKSRGGGRGGGGGGGGFDRGNRW
jgi:cold-inducible RNA-binding protein